MLPLHLILRVQQPRISLTFLAGIEVTAPHTTGAVATLGDSITNGDGSTPGAFHRWSDYLAKRLNQPNGRKAMAVLNQGISGKSASARRDWADALARFDRDVLAQSGITHVIVYEGINDIVCPTTSRNRKSRSLSAELIAALNTINRARACKGSAYLWRNIDAL